MLSLPFFYVVLPILLGWLLIKAIRRWAPFEAPEHLKRLNAETPMERRTFRAVRVDGSGAARTAVLLGDFDTLPEAVDAIYLARDAARKLQPVAPAAFLALNDKLETLEEVDS